MRMMTIYKIDFSNFKVLFFNIKLKIKTLK